MQRKLILSAFVTSLVIIGVLFAGSMPAAAQQQCDGIRAFTQQDVSLNSGPTNNVLVQTLPAGTEVTVVTGTTDGSMSEVCLADGVRGWVTTEDLGGEPPVEIAQATAIPPTPVPVATTVPSAANTGEGNLDDDDQLCEHDKCSLDVGVNEYPEPSDTAQIGFAWGSAVSWDGNLTEGDFAFVILNPGFYPDLTLTSDGGVRVYNHPKSWTPEQVRALTMAVSNEVLAGTAIAGATYESFPVWDSEIVSQSNSAMGTEGVGNGDKNPQLDGQEFSCYPEMGECTRNITVADDRQIALVFGTHTRYMNLEGARSDDAEESRRNVAYRCDIVVLTPGVYNGFAIFDGRVEVYNVPAYDQSGWFRNLVAERVEEQHLQYGCPMHATVPIWNADGTSTDEYFLRQVGEQIMVGGPRAIQPS